MTPRRATDRTAKEWEKELKTDMGLIIMQIFGQDPPNAINFAVALKEARRLQSDLYRIARDIHGIAREEIDRIAT